MEWFLVEIMKIQRKSKNEDACKTIYDRTGKPVVFSLWIKPQTDDFLTNLFLFFSILLQLDRSQLTAVRCN